MASPVISYPGAKWRFYPYMVEYFPLDMETFIEPFLGGGSVTLSVADDPRFKNLSRMIAGDLAPEMWAFWTGVRDNPEGVIEIATRWFNEACPTHKTMYENNVSRANLAKYLGDKAVKIEEDESLLPEQKSILQDKMKIYLQGMGEAERFWKWSQGVETSGMTIEERAARTLLVNKISFSGMGDSGSLSRDQFCDFRIHKLDEVREASKLLKRVEIYNVSFEETMKFAHEKPDKTFIFLDPPYFKQESSGLYGRNGDTHRGFPHEKFGEVTKSMPCKWFVTYDDSTFVRHMFNDNTVDGKKIYLTPFTIPGGYMMAMNSSEDALAGEELFISNYPLSSDEEELDF